MLNLAGLWGANRSFRNWVDRVAPDKATLRLKVAQSKISTRGIKISTIEERSCNPRLGPGTRHLTDPFESSFSDSSKMAIDRHESVREISSSYSIIRFTKKQI